MGRGEGADGAHRGGSGDDLARQRTDEGFAGLRGALDERVFGDLLLELLAQVGLHERLACLLGSFRVLLLLGLLALLLTLRAGDRERGDRMTGQGRSAGRDRVRDAVRLAFEGVARVAHP